METKYNKLKIEIKEKGGKIMKKFLKITGIIIAFFIITNTIAVMINPDIFKQEINLGEKNALKCAENYLKLMAFSEKDLIEQLKFEGFSDSEANYAVNNINVDWNEQAVKCAEFYLKYTNLSKQELIDQLKFEGFTQEQAEYGATAVGY